jgi:threonine/homoserine/homoserine lactone efflux protein
VIALLLKGLTLGFAAAVQPGPFQAYIITESLHHGRRHTLPAAFAPLISDGPIIALMLFVLNQVPDSVHALLYLAGGLFVMYLALDALRAWQRFEATALIKGSSSGQDLFRAVMLNVLNPGPYLFWGLVSGPILLAGWRTAPINGLAFLFAFYATLVTGLGVIISLFGTARQFGPSVTRALLGVSAVVLAGFGLYELWMGVMGLLA